MCSARKVKHFFAKLFDYFMHCTDEGAFAEAIFCDSFACVAHWTDCEDNLQQNKSQTNTYSIKHSIKYSTAQHRK
jgi:hypothetical protein